MDEHSAIHREILEFHKKATNAINNLAARVDEIEKVQIRILDAMIIGFASVNGEDVEALKRSLANLDKEAP